MNATVIGKVVFPCKLPAAVSALEFQLLMLLMQLHVFLEATEHFPADRTQPRHFFRENIFARSSWSAALDDNTRFDIFPTSDILVGVEIRSINHTAADWYRSFLLDARPLTSGWLFDALVILNIVTCWGFNINFRIFC